MDRLLYVALATLGAAQPSLAAKAHPVTVKEHLGPKGGTVQVPEVGFSISFPRGALTRHTDVKVRVAREQFKDLSLPGYILFPRGIEPTLDLDALAPNAVMALRLDFSGQYDAVATTLGIANARGFTLAVPSQQSGQTGLLGSLDQSALRALSRRTRCPPRKTHEATNLHGERGTPDCADPGHLAQPVRLRFEQGYRETTIP